MFKNKNHNFELYSILLNLSRNLFFYKEVNLKDSFETRIYLMFIHFSIILIIFKKKNVKFNQNLYDSLFHSIENDLRELGQGDVAVNKKMKTLNKIFYDILLKINDSNKDFKINKKLIIKYFPQFDELQSKKYMYFNEYFSNFYNFCFELSPETMIKDAINFKV